MPPASAPQMAFAFGDVLDESTEYEKKLLDAFANPDMTSGFLPLAEEALLKHPGAGYILILAATAALLDGHSERALVFLKRYSKRYVPNPANHLLHALALELQNKNVMARAVLERHALTSPYDAMRAFPGGWERREWLSERLVNILGKERKTAQRHAASPAAPTATKTSSKTAPKTATKMATGAALKAAHAASTMPRSSQASPPPVPPLPRVDIDIPFAAEFDLAALLSAAEGPPEIDGAWYELRERFAHLGLAQGFDELLCLPNLHGIETFWYQVETVRKVLKQFRGRVLLADEVGLGKTIEAGMVLKEYLLRGMVESVLVLTPASLVGQWREELETKFDIACATTHDVLLHSDPKRFWSQKRVIASIAQARRAEHSQSLLDRNFDLVIVDEAHHLRNRLSQSYKLVDGLNKRFLLLLSATPVQNDLTELYNLLTLLKPGIFKTLKEFKAVYMTAGKPRQPANPERLRELMRGALIRNTRAVVALKLPSACFHHPGGGDGGRARRLPGPCRGGA
jgi:hypothetical protein